MEKSELSNSGKDGLRRGTRFREQYSNFLQSTAGGIKPYFLHKTLPSSSTVPRAQYSQFGSMFLRNMDDHLLSP